jgi:hypothetical protein
MAEKMLKKEVCLAIVLGLMLTLPLQNAFAREEHRRNGHRDEIVVVRGSRYHYRDGRFYRPWFFGLEFSIGPVAGAVVRVLPFGYRTIIVGGTRYYYYDNVYYTDCPSGYIVVPAPAVSQYQGVSGETITINVPNSNGSYTPVTLVRRNNGYVGPQGEFYAGNPTIDQLKALYGK